MVDYEVVLIGEKYAIDSVGNQTLVETRSTIPIIAIESVYASEFYQAKAQGFKPTLRIKISSLNYDSQSEVEYLNTKYSVIRVDTLDNETLALVCEKRLGV